MELYLEWQGLPGPKTTVRSSSIFMSYNRGAVLTWLRVLSLRLSFGVDLNDGVALDALRVYGVAPSISTFLAGVAC